MSFIFGGNTGETAASVKRKRDMANAMLDSVLSGQPRTLAEGIGAIGTAIGGRIARDRADKRIRQGEAQATSLFESLLFGGAGGRGNDAPAMSGGDAPIAADTVNSRVAAAHGLDRDTLHQRQLMAESGGDLNAVSPAGARGLMQIMPETAAAPGFGLQPLENIDDPAANETFGRSYMDAMLNRYGGNEERALVAYNWGVGNADKWNGDRASLPAETQGYLAKILDQPQNEAGRTFDPAPQATGMASGYDPRIIQALSNPYLSQEQRGILQTLFDAQIKANAPVDPLKALQIQKLQRESERGGRPWWAGENGAVDAAYLAAKGAGKPETNVTVNSEPADGNLRKALDIKTGQQWADYQEQAANSAAIVQDLDMMDELIGMAPQGPVQGRLAEMFPGVNAAGDAFQAIVKRVAPTLRAPGSGSTSDIEYEGMLRSLPALRNKPEANRAIAAMMGAKAEINMERGQIITQYQTGDISAAEARRQIAALDKRSIMTPELRSIIGALGDQPGTTTEAVPDGVDPEIWEVMTPEERALFQ